MAIGDPANRPVLLSKAAITAVILLVLTVTAWDATESPARLVATIEMTYEVAGVRPVNSKTPEPT